MRARPLPCALICLTLLCAPALAQDPYEGGPANPPPVRTTMDSNGVNLATGQLAFTLGVIATGGNPGEQLGYAMQWEGTVLRDPTLGWIQVTGANIYHVSIGEASETFSYSGTAFTSQQGTGSTLSFSSSTGIYTYRTSDGTVFLFDRQYSSPYPEQDTVARLTQVTTPRGVVTTYAYDVVDYIPGDDPNVRIYANRVGSIRNNLGFELDLDYAIDGIAPNNYQAHIILYNRITRVTAINRAGAAATVWPFMEFARGGTSSAPTITATDNLGRGQTVTTNAAGRITRITRPEAGDADVVIGYDSNARLSSFDDGAGEWTYSYGWTGEGITNALINPPVGGNVAVVIDPDIDQPTSMTNGAGETVTWQYDGSGRVTMMTMPEGNSIEYDYDARGNVTTVTRNAKPGSSLADIVTTASYPSSCANPLTCNLPSETAVIVGADQRITNWFYDDTHGGVTRVRFPAPVSGGIRPQIDFRYSNLHARYRNAQGNIVDAPSPVWQLTRVEQCISLNTCDGTADEAETIITRTDGSNATNLLPRIVRRQAGNNSVGASTSYSYDPFANLQVIDGPLTGSDDTVHYRYNEGIQLAGVIGPDPDGAVTTQRRVAQRYTYDDNGNVTQADVGTVNGTSDTAWSAFAVSRSTVHGYDTVARRINSTLHDATTNDAPFARSTFSYDAGSRLTCSALRMTLTGSVPTNACTADTPAGFGEDRIAEYTYDNANRVTRIADRLDASADVTRWTRAFTDNGAVHTLADGEGNLTTYTYDGFDRLSSRCYPNASGGGSSATDCDEYLYNVTGTISRRRLRGGGDIVYSHDRLDRVTGIDYPLDTPTVSFEYDDLNRMTQAAQPAITLAFTYDQLGRLLVEDNSVLGAVTSTYRADGVRTHLEYPDGEVFEITRNQAGGPEAMFEEAAGTGARIGRWSYDALNRVSEFTWGQNPEAGRSGLTLGYDAVSRLASMAVDLPTAASPGDVTIGPTAYNPASQIVTRTRSNAAYAFDDPEEGTSDYAHAGPPLSPNGLNQYRTVTGLDAATMSYDARGNLTVYNAAGGSSGDRAYTYDARNLMVTASLDGGTTTNLSYDPLGRLYQVNAPGTAEDRRYLWDGDAIIAELNPTTGAIRRRFVHAPGSLGAPIAQYEGASVSAASRRYLQTDERGTVISAVEADDGTQSATNTYDPYGRPGAGNSGQFQYAGQLWLPETGTYYMRARMYEPVLGRFLQTDPIGYAGGMNLCAYVGNDPINWTDPLGLGPGDAPVVHPPITVTGPSNEPPPAAASSAGLFGWGSSNKRVPGTGTSQGERRPKRAEDEGSCAEVPAIQDPRVQQAARDALAKSLETGYEHAFIASRLFATDVFVASEIYTSRLPNRVLGAAHAIHIEGALDAPFDMLTPEVVVHAHRSETPVGSRYRDEDASYARLRNITVAAIDTTGRITCVEP